MQSNNGLYRPDRGGTDSAAENPGGHGRTTGNMTYEDPWRDGFAPGWGEPDGTGAAVPAAVPAARTERRAPEVRARDVYLEVQRSAAFQEVRGRYRRFVLPGVVLFLGWYVGYVVTATAAPGLMARPVTGAVNVGMLAGLGQFLTTFLFTWAYSRHARLRRDRAALDLRWDTQELTRGGRGGAL